MKKQVTVAEFNTLVTEKRFTCDDLARLAHTVGLRDTLRRILTCADEERDEHGNPTLTANPPQGAA